jgi:hypothetical protein
MTTTQLVNIGLAIFTPILTAALGIIGLIAGDWHQRRTQTGRRKLAFEDASRQVAFATEWWNASKLIADSPEAEQQATAHARTWLEDASELVAESEPNPVGEESPITLHRLLLLYPLRGPAARFFRGAFYFFLGLVPFWVGGAIHSTLDPQRLGVSRYLFGEYFYTDVVVILALTVFAIALRFCAICAEKSTPTGEKRSRPTLRRALLLYSFTSRGAKVVRVVFYLWLVFSTALAIGFVSDVIHEPLGLLSGVVQFVGIVGYAVALRYWAASLEARSA